MRRLLAALAGIACLLLLAGVATHAPARQTSPAVRISDLGSLGAGSGSWKILVLIYGRTDQSWIDGTGAPHHVIAQMTDAERQSAADAARQFTQTDIPQLTSGAMVPRVTVRLPERTLTNLDPNGPGFWPSPANTAPERDPSFDSVIVIWDPRGTSQVTGQPEWIGSAAGLTPSMGSGQTYETQIIESVFYGHRNVFKHEYGHSILSYFDASGKAPKPAVSNHTEAGAYVHCPTGGAYVWQDETLANPIPNSIYDNASGFTHDYYSGTAALAAQPTRCLGVTREAWALGGPVTPGPLSGWSQAKAIDEHGRIAGSTSTVTPAETPGDPHAFLRTDGKMVDLGGLAPGLSTAAGIAGHGATAWVVGASVSPSGETHAFLWQHGSCGTSARSAGRSAPRPASTRGARLQGGAPTGSGASARCCCLYGETQAHPRTASPRRCEGAAAAWPPGRGGGRRTLDARAARLRYVPRVRGGGTSLRNAASPWKNRPIETQRRSIIGSGWRGGTRAVYSRASVS